MQGAVNPTGGARAGLVTLALLLTGIGSPREANADPLTIDWWSIDGGGSGYVQTGSLVLGSTLGQHDAGRLITSGYDLWGGFWTPSVGAPTGVAVETIMESEAPPRVARIHPAAPNPVVGQSRIALELPEARPVEAKIFSVSGSLVRTLESRLLPAGRHALVWDASDAHGRPVGAGIYFVRVSLGALRDTQKLIVVR